VKQRRTTPRRREAPRWSADEWASADLTLQARAGSVCECCGGFAVRFERHHRKRRRDGGDRFANIVLLASDCHTYWTAHPAEARERGLIVPTWAEIPSTPLLWHGTEWSLLHDDGGRTRTAAPEQMAANGPSMDE
jgi:hypothetical protein